MKRDRGKLMIYKTWFAVHNILLSYSDICTDALTRNQFVLLFCLPGLNFMDPSSRQFSHSRHFVFVKLVTTAARRARQPVSAAITASRFVTPTLNLCHIRGFLKSNSSKLTSCWLCGACAFMSQSFTRLLKRPDCDTVSYSMLTNILLRHRLYFLSHN